MLPVIYSSVATLLCKKWEVNYAMAFPRLHKALLIMRNFMTEPLKRKLNLGKLYRPYYF